MGYTPHQRFDNHAKVTSRVACSLLVDETIEHDIKTTVHNNVI